MCTSRGEEYGGIDDTSGRNELHFEFVVERNFHNEARARHIAESRKGFDHGDVLVCHEGDFVWLLFHRHETLSDFIDIFDFGANFIDGRGHVTWSEVYGCYLSG